MLIDIVKKGSTDRSVLVRVVDSAAGTPETGVAYNTAGVDLWYRREGATKTSLTEATLATTDAAHADGGFIHVGDGYCRLDLPDAAFATGANYVDVGGTFTDMIVIGGRVKLVAYDPEDTVRLGLTALPNAAAAASGGLPTVDSTNSVKIQTNMKKNQALSAFAFLMTDNVNHNPVTGKTVTITRSVDGGAFGAGTLGSVTELSNGVYLVDMAAGDRNGNVVTYRMTATGCDDLFVTHILEA
jgi:hypothetical protein